MRFINKKIIISILCLIEVTSLFLMYKSFSNKPIKELENRNKVNRKTFSMYVENGNGNYDIYNNNSFPKDYLLNTDKSTCTDLNGNIINNAISYNDNKVTVTSNKTIYCTLYFDNHSITLTVSTDGVNNTLPTYNHYKAILTCDNAVSNFNTKYQRIEISEMNKSFTNCNLNYTNDTTSYTLLSSIVQSNGTQISSTNNEGGADVSYRYTGKTPNNFIWFNNEMWRIIGLIPTCTSSGCNTKEYLVKIIRNEILGGYAYDTSSAIRSELKGDWGSNTLYTLLNSYYYGKENGTNNSSCRGYYYSTYTTVIPNCDFSEKGISSDESDYYGRMVKDVYWNTGASNCDSTTNEIYKTETAKQTVNGKIGLMNASDHGYAGLNYDTIMNTITFANYAETNWLYGKGVEWTNIQNLSSSWDVIEFDHVGIAYNYTSGGGLGIRPVVYLDSNVYVISGDGIEANPYVIGM